MDPKTPKATALERAKQFGARALQEVVKPTGKVLLGMAQELGKAPIKAAMAPTDILSIAATGKPLPPLKVPGLGEVSSYGRRAVELQKEPGYTPAIAALQAGSEGVLDIASAGQIGALARAARTARGAVAAPKVSPAKTNVLQERLGTARDAITRSMTRSIREPSMGLSIKRVGTSADNLTSEARKYKSAEEFVKAQGDTLYHGGTPIKEVGNMRSPWKAFYMSENPTYAKSYGGSKSTLNEMVLSKDAKIADLRKPNEELVAQLDEMTRGRTTGKTFNIQKPDGSYINVPEVVDAPNFGSYTQKQVIEGIKQGKAHFAEEPAIKEALKKLGYDGMITQESKFGANYGVWNKSAIKTKSQLTDLWKKTQDGSRGKTNALKKKIDTE